MNSQLDESFHLQEWQKLTSKNKFNPIKIHYKNGNSINSVLMNCIWIDVRQDSRGRTASRLCSSATIPYAITVDSVW